MKREEEAWRQLRVAIISSSTSDTRVTPCCRCSLRLEGSRSSSRNSDVYYVYLVYTFFLLACVRWKHITRRAPLLLLRVPSLPALNASFYAVRRERNRRCELIKRRSMLLRWIKAKRCWREPRRNWYWIDRIPVSVIFLVTFEVRCSIGKLRANCESFFVERWSLCVYFCWKYCCWYLRSWEMSKVSNVYWLPSIYILFFRTCEYLNYCWGKSYFI